MSLLGNLKYLSATELISLIKNKDISPVELIEHTINLIEKRNPSLNALIYFGFDDARKEAKKAEQLIMKTADYKQSGSLSRDQGTETLNQYLQTKKIWISHS